MNHHPGLKFEEDRQFQKIEWGVQRVSWMFWVLIMAAAMVGLLGQGPLSNAQTTTPSGTLTVIYERFVRFHHPTTMELLLDLSETARAPAEIKLSQSLIDCIQILRIEPEPTEHRIEPDGIVYAFRPGAGSGTGKISFHVEYEKAGTATGTITLLGHEPIPLTQFVYP